MIKPEQIRSRALELWNSGCVLRAWMGQDGLFPVSIVVAEAASLAFTDNWTAVESWRRELAQGCKCGAGSGYRLEYIEFDHPRWGRQRAPRRVVFDEPIDLIAYLGVQSQFKRVVALAREIRRRFPVLKAWIEASPAPLLDQNRDWPRLLSLLERCLSRPQPELWVLQLNPADPDYPFIQGQRAIFRELLERLLQTASPDRGPETA